MGKLVKDPGLSQGKRAPQQPFLQNADLPSIESIEATYGLDALGGGFVRQSGTSICPGRNRRPDHLFAKNK